MLTEEIHLVAALEKAGLRSVETDLGEWILQLAKETPSHLIVPALHKQKTDIKNLFDEKLGHDDRPDSDDPKVLVERGRVALRNEFIRADLGITGVNFAVAETGTIVLVSNEGNGRLVTSGPAIHIALVPIEKVVPTIEEAVTLVKLLTWSAIGKITTYVSWITGPRREKEADGPRELHIVLVDNGRSEAVGGPLEEALHCIRCSACLNVCPVYRRVGGHTYDSVYSGPIGISLTPIVQGASQATDELAHASSLCGACEEVCPVRIDIPRLILRSREQAVKAGRAGFERFFFFLYAAIVRRTWMYRLALRIGGWASRLMARDRWLARAPGLRTWTSSRDFPSLPKRSFRQRFADRDKVHGR
jgi:L-lactate dehydrogenase complex protein LldF